MNDLDFTKKSREKRLIDEFIVITPEYSKYRFDFYDENPDLVYSDNNRQLGFESILVIPSNKSRCHFDSTNCELRFPTNRILDYKLADIQVELARTLFEHLRHYKIPTVIVFTIINKKLSLEAIATHFRLPEVTGHNIQDYYLSNGERSLKIAESGKW